jgi:hypothetical protein
MSLRTSLRRRPERLGGRRSAVEAASDMNERRTWDVVDVKDNFLTIGLRS